MKSRFHETDAVFLQQDFKYLTRLALGNYSYCYLAARQFPLRPSQPTWSLFFRLYFAWICTVGCWLIRICSNLLLGTLFWWCLEFFVCFSTDKRRMIIESISRISCIIALSTALLFSSVLVLENPSTMLRGNAEEQVCLSIIWLDCLLKINRSDFIWCPLSPGCGCQASEEPK